MDLPAVTITETMVAMSMENLDKLEDGEFIFYPFLDQLLHT